MGDSRERVLVVVSADPETSHRANEAVRIALGILAGDNPVTIALLGPGAKVLDPAAEDYVDGEDTLKHVATLTRLGQVFHVERAAIPADGGARAWNAGGAPVAPISTEELARLVAESDRVLVF
ncbi:MAG TPA: DsrE family protein [Methylomirabilota bacterium]|nr:DsrE family protein [Methylomirabilota bacterium]